MLWLKMIHASSPMAVRVWGGGLGWGWGCGVGLGWGGSALGGDGGGVGVVWWGGGQRGRGELPRILQLKKDICPIVESNYFNLGLDNLFKYL